MKIRKGFVSNSSSSSFIIKLSEMILVNDPEMNGSQRFNGEYKRLVSKGIESDLINCGWDYTGYNNPLSSFDPVNHKDVYDKSGEFKTSIYMRKDYGCNGDPRKYLFEHKIPYVCELNYGTMLEVWDGDQTHDIVQYRNRAQEHFMGGSYVNDNGYWNKNSEHYIPYSEYIKDYEDCSIDKDDIL